MCEFHLDSNHPRSDLDPRSYVNLHVMPHEMATAGSWRSITSLTVGGWTHWPWSADDLRKGTPIRNSCQENLICLGWQLT